MESTEEEKGQRGLSRITGTQSGREEQSNCLFCGWREVVSRTRQGKARGRGKVRIFGKKVLRDLLSVKKG